KPRKPLAQLFEEPLGLLTMLESNDEVVGEAHDHDISERLLLPPLLDPEVEHVMEIDVRQERADAAALDRTHLGLCPPPLLQHAGLEPLLYQSHDAPVRDAVLDKLHQPPVIESVEEATNVGIEHPVHLSLVDCGGQGIECVMRTSPRSESIGEAEEVDLI